MQHPRALSAIAAGVATLQACLPIDLNGPTPAEYDARYLFVPESMKFDCGFVGSMLALNLAPPLIDYEGEPRVLLEFAVEDGLAGFDANARVALVSAPHHADLFADGLVRLPVPRRAWRDEGGTYVPVAIEPHAIDGLFAVASDSCAAVTDSVCNRDCPGATIETDFALRDAIADDGVAFDTLAGELLRGISLGDHAFVLVDSAAYVVERSGSIPVPELPEVVSIARHDNGVVWILDSDRCLWRGDGVDRLEQVQCAVTSTHAASITVGESPDDLLIVSSEGLFRYQSGAITRLAELPSDRYYGRWSQLERLGEDEALISFVYGPAFWYEHGRLHELDVTAPRGIVARPGKDPLILTGSGNAQSILHRVHRDPAASTVDLELVADDFAHSATAFAWTAVGVVVGDASGRIFRIGSDGACELTQVGRIPRALTTARNDLVVLGDDVLDFNYVVFTEPRAYFVRMPERTSAELDACPTH